MVMSVIGDTYTIQGFPKGEKNHRKLNFHCIMKYKILIDYKELNSKKDVVLNEESISANKDFGSRIIVKLMHNPFVIIVFYLYGGKSDNGG